MKKLNKILLAGTMVTFLAAGCNALRLKDSNQTVAVAQSQAEQTSNQAGQNLIIRYQGEAGKNALEILKQKYQVQTKEFAGLGEFVESINGVKPDSKHFWKFFIDGQGSNLGAGSYVTKNSDSLEWRLAEVNNEQ